MSERELLVLEIENDEPGPVSFLWLFLFFVLHVPLIFKETVEWIFHWQDVFSSFLYGLPYFFSCGHPGKRTLMAKVVD